MEREIERILRWPVQVITYKMGEKLIKELLHSLQEQMRLGPSAWLAKAIERQKGPTMQRFDDMESEGWDE